MALSYLPLSIQRQNASFLVKKGFPTRGIDFLCCTSTPFNPMLFLVQQGPIMIEPSLPNATSVNAIMSYQSTISTIAATPEEALDFSLKNNQNNCTSECNIKNFGNP